MNISEAVKRIDNMRDWLIEKESLDRRNILDVHNLLTELATWLERLDSIPYDAESEREYREAIR